jgi:hypothetical protein
VEIKKPLEKPKPLNTITTLSSKSYIVALAHIWNFNGCSSLLPNYINQQMFDFFKISVSARECFQRYTYWPKKLYGCLSNQAFLNFLLYINIGPIWLLKSFLWIRLDLYFSIMSILFLNQYFLHTSISIKMFVKKITVFFKKSRFLKKQL